MSNPDAKDSASPAAARGSPRSLSDHIEQNVESIVALQRRDMAGTSRSQRRVERVSRVLGQPFYLVGILVFTVLWVIINLLIPQFNGRPFDPPPFNLLDGVLSLSALVTSTIVLIAQNRQAKLEQQQTQLELQVNMLTEQKVTKLIHLIEELRKDMPMVRDRHDPLAAGLQESADAAKVLSVIEDRVSPHAAPPAAKKGT